MNNIKKLLHFLNRYVKRERVATYVKSDNNIIFLIIDRILLYFICFKELISIISHCAHIYHCEQIPISLFIKVDEYIRK